MTFVPLPLESGGIPTECTTKIEAIGERQCGLSCRDCAGAGGGGFVAANTAAAVIAAGAVGVAVVGACPRCVRLFAMVGMGVKAVIAVVWIG